MGLMERACGGCARRTQLRLNPPLPDTGLGSNVSQLSGENSEIKCLSPFLRPKLRLGYEGKPARLSRFRRPHRELQRAGGRQSPVLARRHRTRCEEFNLSVEPHGGLTSGACCRLFEGWTPTVEDRHLRQTLLTLPCCCNPPGLWRTLAAPTSVQSVAASRTGRIVGPSSADQVDTLGSVMCYRSRLIVRSSGRM